MKAHASRSASGGRSGDERAKSRGPSPAPLLRLKTKLASIASPRPSPILKRPIGESSAPISDAAALSDDPLSTRRPVREVVAPRFLTDADEPSIIFNSRLPCRTPPPFIADGGQMCRPPLVPSTSARRASLSALCPAFLPPRPTSANHTTFQSSRSPPASATVAGSFALASSSYTLTSAHHESSSELQQPLEGVSSYGGGPPSALTATIGNPSGNVNVSLAQSLHMALGCSRPSSPPPPAQHLLPYSAVPTAPPPPRRSPFKRQASLPPLTSIKAAYRPVEVKSRPIACPSPVVDNSRSLWD